jgi:type III pantothenate kinase
MLLAIDIGNSSTKFGIFDGDELFHKFSIQTKRDYTVEELLFDRLKLIEKQFIQVDIDTCIVASVVPDVNAVIAQVCRELFKINPQFVDAGWDLGFSIDYDPPEAAGIDRLVNCFAAASKYGTPVVACSFGTATTIDVVSSNNEYVGGVIAPGMATAAKALQLATAKLPNIPIEKPDAVLGKTTIASIQSGIVNGHIAMVAGLLAKIANGGKVVATGGFASLIAPEVPAIDVVDENLTLDGLRMLAGRAPQHELAFESEMVV